MTGSGTQRAHPYLSLCFTAPFLPPTPPHPTIHPTHLSNQSFLRHKLAFLVSDDCSGDDHDVSVLLLLQYRVQLQHYDCDTFKVHSGLFCCFRNPLNSDMYYKKKKKKDNNNNNNKANKNPQQLITMNLSLRGGIAQLVERTAEKSGAILARVRVPGAAKDFSPRVNFQCRLFYGVRTAPVCNRMHQHLCAR